MKQIDSFLIRRAALLALAIIACGSAPRWSGARSLAQYPQQQTKDQASPKPQTSNDELQGGKKVEAATDAAARLEAATEFVKKFPKSGLMDNVARLVAAKIAETQDPNQKAAFCETFLTVFKGAPQTRLIYPVEIDAYRSANKPDDAFRVAGVALQQSPEDVELLYSMVMVGRDQVKQKNLKYVSQTQEYGVRAIKLIEAEKRPADFTDASWADYKTKVLPQLYQSLGFVAAVLKKNDEARPNLEKAIQLNPADAFSFYLLFTVTDDEYQELVAKYKATLPGADRDAMLNKALEKMDRAIDLLAHAVGLSEGDPKTQPLHDAALQDLQLYYNYRHKDKGAAGMQELINKYGGGRTATAASAATAPTATAPTEDAKGVADKVFPSVVMLQMRDNATNRVTLASGFFVRPNIIATNYHVIEGTPTGTAKIVGKGKLYPISEVVAEDRLNDLVLLKVREGDGEPIAFADASTVGVGQVVYALGNPEGLEGTISNGIVSGIGIRQIGGRSLLQITAPISHGSSGGPVVNKKGELIGVAVSYVRDGQNLNFAVPASTLSLLMRSIN